MNLVLAIDFKKDPLLHSGVEERVPHLPRISRLLIGVLHAHSDVIMLGPLVKLCCTELGFLGCPFNDIGFLR
jgi:hypothetical protein